MANNFSNDARIISVYNVEPSALTVDSKGMNTLSIIGTVNSNTTDFKQGIGSMQVNAVTPANVLSIAQVNQSPTFPFKASNQDDFTICHWVRWDVLPTVGNLQVLWKSGVNHGFAYAFNNAGTVQLAIFVSTSVVTISGFIPVVGRWYHIGWRWDGTNQSVIVVVFDDFTKIEKVLSITHNQASGVNTEPFEFGGRSDTNNENFEGSMDEIVIADELLSIPEISKIRKGIFGQSLLPVGPFEYPDWNYPRPIAGTNSKTAVNISADAHAITYVFSASKSGTIERIHVESGNINVSGNIRFSLQDVPTLANGPDFNGDGIDDFFVDQNVSIANTTIDVGPLTSDGTPTGIRKVVNEGDVIAFVMKRSPGSLYDGNFLIINSTLAATEAHDQVPTLTPNVFRSIDSESSWSFIPGMANFAVEMDDGSFMKHDMILVELFVETTSIGLNTSPDEIGMRFIPEFTFQTNGFVTYGDNGEAEFRIYDANDNILTSVRTGLHGGSSAAGQRRKHHFTPVILQAGELYRMTLSYLNPTASTGIFGYDVALNKRLDQSPLGIDCFRTERTDGGAWVDITDQRMCMSLVVNGIEVESTFISGGQRIHQVGSGINAGVARIG